MIAPEKFRARTATAAAPPRAGGPLELVVPPFAVARIDAGPAAALVS
jgi:hypothetical protein